LLAKGFNGLIAWDIAAGKDKKEVLEKLRVWCGEVQITSNNEPNI
jgi:hypothetical protein